MIPVYICEDNQYQKEEYANIISKIILIEEYDMQLIATYQNPFDLLSELKVNISAYDSSGIYLLDVDLGTTMNGIDLASRIRELDTRAFIIFITTHSELAPLTFQYQVEALDYILKDHPDQIFERLRSCLHKAYARTHFNHIDPTLSFSVNKHTIYIKESSIIYVSTTSEPHQLRVVTDSDEFYIRGNLKKISSLLSHSFVKIHRTNIVNCNQIESIDHKKMLVHMSNGHICPISRNGFRLIPQN